MKAKARKAPPARKSFASKLHRVMARAGLGDTANTIELAIASIRLDGGTQPRAEIDQLVVDEYADAFRAKVMLPAVDVFHDGTDHWLADGFHRVAGAGSAGLKTIDAEIHQGTREDAVWFSAGANRAHGLRRTNADKRRAVLTALAHPRGKSARAVAEHCGVSPNFVNELRRQVSSKDTSRATQRVQGVDGKRYPASKPSPTARLLPEVRALVRETPIAEDRRIITGLARVEPEKQLEVAKRVIAGASLAAAQRNPHDFYATPYEAIAPLLPFIRTLPGGRWIEPCVGDGSIVRAVKRRDVAWDLVDIRKDAGPLVAELGRFEACDYLKRPAPVTPYDVGLTNVPFDLAEELIRKLIKECRIVVSLLALNFAATNGRIPFHRQHRSNLKVLADRPSFTGDGATDMNEVAWWVFGMPLEPWELLVPVTPAGAAP